MPHLFQLVATKPFPYNGRALEPGDRVEVGLVEMALIMARPRARVVATRWVAETPIRKGRRKAKAAAR